MQGSYVWSKSIANGATSSSSDSSQPTTLRNRGIDRLPSGFDIRNAFKINGIYDFPFGPGKKFLDVHNVVARKALEGWQLAGNVRIQSGLPFTFSSFGTFNQNGDGVTLHNMTGADLQNMIGIYKGTDSSGRGIVTYLPDSVIYNTKAAFGQGGLSASNVDPNAKYIGPAAPGQVGYRSYIYLPWTRYFNFSVVKKTRIRESMDLTFTATALNIFNLTNFNTFQNVGSSFGQVTGAYRDTSGTVDPGGRIIEFNFRLNF
jgi:hypothetical protein